MGNSIKDRVLVAFEAHKNEFISGGHLADELGVSRNAIWKAVRSLIDAGYRIESITGKGYRLAGSCSILSAASIERYLHAPQISIEFHHSLDSTNSYLKRRAEEGAPEGLLAVADEQTAGRGRQGRPFYSPAGTGVYFSLLLRPDFALEDIALITSYAAVATAQAMDEIFDVTTGIKWVNDLFLDGHKVCGILTEASFDAETGSVAYVVVGIGINVLLPEGGFPAELGQVAKSLTGHGSDTADLRARLIANVIDRFMEQYPDIPSHPHLEDYRRRSILDGRTVEAFLPEGPLTVKVEGINDDFTLRVRTPDGMTRNLSHGEVHIPSGSLR